MYCIKKKLFVLIVTISSILYLIIAFNSIINRKNVTMKAKAQDGGFCERAGLYDLPDASKVLKNNISAICAGNINKPQWNGKRGSDAKCYTATAICGKIPGCIKKDCIARISEDIPCINEPVDIQICKDAGIATEYVCMYAGQEITNVSGHYFYSDTTNNNITYKCIKNKDGYNVGARCYTDENGNINAPYSKMDTENCRPDAPSVSVPTATSEPVSTSIPQTTDIPVAPTAVPTTAP